MRCPQSSELPGELALLEQNARQLAELEVEWSELGSIRQIDFHCTFPNPDRRKTFSEKAQGAGFQVRETQEQYGSRCYLIASVRIEPNASTITALQEMLGSFCEDTEDTHGEGNPPDGPSSVDGWKYPPKKKVSFWPNDSRAGVTQAVQDRAAALFGGVLVADPLLDRQFWLPPTVRDRLDQPRTTFKLVPSEFLRKALTMQPKTPEPTASAFSQWVYSLYGDAEGTEQDIVDGKDAEQEIWERRKSAASCNDNSFLRRKGLGWSLMHNGLHLRDGGMASHFVIPHLRVGGEALRASPDLMYANRNASELMIVEIKFSRQPIPRNLWPNVWAQLWCYAQLPAASQAERLTVIGEVWGEAWSRGYGRGRNRVEGSRVLFLRALARRNPRALAYDKFFRRLFEIYVGQS